MKQTTFLSVLGLALSAGQLQAQVVQLNTKSFGYGTDVWFSRTYDSQSVMTFLAKVQSVVETGPASKDSAVAVSYVVRPYTREDIGGGKVKDIFQAPITVEVGPRWFVKDQSTKVKTGDYIAVTASRVDENGHTFFVAEMIKRNRAVLGLRRPSGEPFWLVLIDANSSGSNGNADNPARDAVIRTNQEIANGQYLYDQPDPLLNPYPAQIANVNVFQLGPPQARFGNVLIYGWPWYSPYNGMLIGPRW